MIIGARPKILPASAGFRNRNKSWDVKYAKFNGGSSYGVFRLSVKQTSPQGIFFKPDGLSMFVIDNNNDDVSEYRLSAAWNLMTATLVKSSKRLGISVQDSTPTSVFFKPDGLKMYVIGSTTDSVHEFNLSTAWDISTLSSLQSVSIVSTGSGETAPTGVFFKPDGLKMYVLGSVTDSVHEYNLSTAWNVTTATLLQSFSVNAQDSVPGAVFFKPDGLKMYILGGSGRDVNEYNLGTAWNVSTATFLQNVATSQPGLAPSGLFFKSDGLKMYVVSPSNDAVYEYNLSTAWNASTATFSVPTQNYLNISAEETSPAGFFFKPDGLKMYIIGQSGDDVNEYNLGTAWDITTSSFVQRFIVSTKEATPSSLFFKPDGLKMYIVGQSSDAVHEYNLSTAWNVTTATFLQSLSVNTQELIPRGLFFKPDGLKMYVIGSTSNSVHEYNLSTAWNVTTATLLQSFSVASQQTAPNDIFFKPDGLKMYIVGQVPAKIDEYELSNVWDVSTANYNQRVYNISPEQIGFPQDIFIKPDGTKLYVVCDQTDAVWAHDIG